MGCCSVISYRLPSFPPKGEHVVPNSNGIGTREVTYYENEPDSSDQNFPKWQDVGQAVDSAKLFAANANSSLCKTHFGALIFLVGTVLAAAYLVYKNIKALDMTIMDKAMVLFSVVTAIIGCLFLRNYFSQKKKVSVEYKHLLEEIERKEDIKLYFTKEGIAEIQKSIGSL